MITDFASYGLNVVMLNYISSQFYPENLQHSGYKASYEAIWSGSAVFSKNNVQLDKG